MKRLTVSQAARAVGVSPHTLRRWESAGRVPPARRDLAGRRRYDERDVALIRTLTRRGARGG